MADLLLAVAEAMASFPEKREYPDLIAFGPSTFTALKHLVPPATMIYFNPHSLAGIQYEIENDIPFGEFRFKRWVTEGGERKLRVYKTIPCSVKACRYLQDG